MTSSRSFAIVPAAGESVRMGRSKLLLTWQGKTLLEHVLAAWRASSVRATLVVVKPDDAELARIAEAASAIVVRPPLPPPDMRASVTYGLGEIRRLFSPTDADAWLVAPADLPRLSTAVIDRVIARRAGFQPAVESESLAGWKPALQEAAIVPVAHGRRGHPVLFPWSWTERLKHLAADQGLNALLREGRTTTVDCSDLVAANAFDDVDTPEEYESL